MSRNTRTFEQLFNYMRNGADHHSGVHFYTRNLYTRDGAKIIEEYERNSRCYRERKNGIHLYHEVISLTRSKKLSLKKQKEYLFQIVNDYCQARCPDNLVVGFLHEEHERDIHYHLMISANELDSRYKHRLSTKAFDQIKQDAEMNVLNNYPQLEQVPVITKGAGKHSNKEYNLKQRTKKPSRKDLLSEKLQALFEEADSPETFFTELSKEKLELYTRGKHTGVKDLERGSKHRFVTLGVSVEFEEMLVRLNLEPAPSPYQPQADKNSPQNILKEAVTGDFRPRQRQAQKEKWKKQQKADEKVKDFKDQTATEKVVEVGKEWLAGDFSNREARARNQERKQRVKDWKAKQAQASKEKEPLSAKTKAKEWMTGNFDDRTQRSAEHFDQQQAIEKQKDKLRKIREKQQQKNSPDKGMDKDIWKCVSRILDNPEAYHLITQRKQMLTQYRALTPIDNNDNYDF